MLTTLTFSRGGRSIDLYLNEKTDKRAKRIIENFPQPLYPSTNEIWQHLLQYNEWDSVVDVGANYGEMSCIAFLYRTSEEIPIYIFEPSHKLMSTLELTFRKARNIHLHENAISNRNQTVYFRNFSSNSGKSNVTHEYPNILKPEVEIEQVEAITLDNVAGLGKRVLIKIDVEGHETEVLQGARNVITNSRELAILIEANQLDLKRIMTDFPGLRPYAYFRLSGKLKPLNDKNLRKVQSTNNRNMYHHDIVLIKKVESDLIFSPMTTLGKRASKFLGSVLRQFKNQKRNGT
jgi:FkbM family methyltransferase